MLITYSLSNLVITINMKEKKEKEIALYAAFLFSSPAKTHITYIHVCICISGSCIMNEDNNFPSQTLTITTLIMISYVQVTHSRSPTNQWERWKTVQATTKLGLN